MNNPEKIFISDTLSIHIFKTSYFIATKIEAYHGRGISDFRLSHDIEDIITVIDGQNDFKNILDAPQDLKVYLRKELNAFLKEDLFIESISSHLEYGHVSRARIERIIGFIKSI
jgi:hypothetical protein